ncbi:MAG: ABC transporter ATP-binding protein [Candidatus Hydrogenedentes bacterium]|nr:ABC transporter ATP-binding protein [Candidatus Hydrogenedentota bacterium]
MNATGCFQHTGRIPRWGKDSPALSNHGKKKQPFKLSSAWRDAKVLLQGHWRRLAFGAVLMVINRASGFVLPASSKFVIDEIVGKQRGELLVPIAIAAGVATLIQASTTFTLSVVVGVAGQKAITDMRRRVHEHVTRLPIRFFDKTQAGILISRIMTDAEGIRNLVGTGIVQLIGGFITAGVALGVLFWLNWHLTALTLITLVGFGLFTSTTFKRLRPAFRQRGEINAEVTGRLNESLGGIRIVKAYTAEKREQIIFTHGVHRLFRNIAGTMTGVSSTTAVATAVVGIIGVIMILVGGNALINGTMTLGDFVMYIFFTGLVAAPVVQISSIVTQISEAFAGLDRIHEIVSLHTEDQEDAQKSPIEKISGDVRFNNVWFEYDPDTPVLKGVSFHAEAGTTTALVGSSGSGKSTLISLVMAFNQPKSGKIFIDARDLGELRLRDYRHHLGIVMQDNFLFDGTVADNIRFSKPGATREDVIRVSKIAHCDEFIEKFDKGYDTVVGERGVRLSGGQRQRVAIARAILADPSILILDEATSSLDSESEAMIQDGLRALRKGRTTFVIAHRLSTIRSADQILVMEHGEIVEHGTHRELIALDGRYRQLHDRQYAADVDTFVNPGEELARDGAK